ncbi:hypothetical protein A3844_28925 [Paenibacillus helianthi]|uniref:Uncharacterized protein n=1 Tax=Paenibacillus helianthi TaxID=1349432 RepID=A0ABX3EHS2_9BACL|nr:hypothetical protein [Paenibacillus helianthi]OKP78739.1 hypothetical protein A3844_28925 [Paenibacillus helianthi]
MSDWYAGIKNKANEVAGGGQGVIKSSQLTQGERAALDLKYPPPTGKAAVRPFVIRGTVE